MTRGLAAHLAFTRFLAVAMLRVKRIDSLTRLRDVVVVGERCSSAVCHLRVAELVGLLGEVLVVVITLVCSYMRNHASSRRAMASHASGRPDST